MDYYHNSSSSNYEHLHCFFCFIFLIFFLPYFLIVEFDLLLTSLLKDYFNSFFFVSRNFYALSYIFFFIFSFSYNCNWIVFLSTCPLKINIKTSSLCLVVRYLSSSSLFLSSSTALKLSSNVMMLVDILIKKL